jgi:hypothetical protein
MSRDDFESIRIRIMQEAYDCSDRGETEAYNSVKVMCLEILLMVASLVAAEREACAKVCENNHTLIADSLDGYDIAVAIRARGEK